MGETLQVADTQKASAFLEKYKHLTDEIHKVVIGQDRIIAQLLTVMFARGHALIIGVPGLAKVLKELHIKGISAIGNLYGTTVLIMAKVSRKAAHRVITNGNHGIFQ